MKKSLLGTAALLLTTVASAPASADPYGWTCPSTWYGMHDGCDCGCGLLDPDCSDAKSSTCEWVWHCDSPEGVIRSQNWRCDGQPLSSAYPDAYVPPIPSTWTGSNEEFLDNVCTCGRGAFDYACDGPDFESCESNYCQPNIYAYPTSSPINNWNCTWPSFLDHYASGDGCDCGYGEPDPDCTDGLASSCDRVYDGCSSVASDANWICGGFDPAALVPSSSYCADTVDWSPSHMRVEEMFLAAINKHRAEGYDCGGTEGYFPPVEPLKMDLNLRCAARKYSTSLICSHTDSSGGGPWDRAALAGYDAECLGENLICGGPNSVGSVEDWFISPGHCANAMRRDVNEVGIGISNLAVMMVGLRH